jgi:hypothetical protein
MALAEMRYIQVAQAEMCCIQVAQAEMRYIQVARLGVLLRGIPPCYPAGWARTAPAERPQARSRNNRDTDMCYPRVEQAEMRLNIREAHPHHPAAGYQ